jgi:hypothetical protein
MIMQAKESHDSLKPMQDSIKVHLAEIQQLLSEKSLGQSIPLINVTDGLQVMG